MEERKILVGMGGWDLAPFDGPFYPVKRGRSFRKLEWYGRFFDCVEVNATFYNSAFSPAQVRRWLEDVAGNPNFVFTVKLFRGFTHTFDATKQDAHRTLQMLDFLAAAEKLGGLVMQFHSSFANTEEHREYLAHLARNFSAHTLFLETRHISWNSPAVYAFLRRHNMHLVNVDLPQIGRHPPFTALSWDGAAYYRLMGRNAKTWRMPWNLEKAGKHMVSDRYNYLYSEKEIRSVAATAASTDARSIFVIFHNDPNANSVFNGFRLRKFVEPAAKLRAPLQLLEAFPSLKDIADPSPP